MHFKTVQALCREEHLVEVIEVNFPRWKLFFFHKNETEHSFEFSISDCVFSTLFILLREKNAVRSLRRWFAGVHEEKSSCINYSEKIMTSCTRILARAPSRRVGSTTGPLKHSRLETEPKHHGDRPFANPVGRFPKRFAQERDFPMFWGKVLQQIPYHSRG